MSAIVVLHHKGPLIVASRASLTVFSRVDASSAITPLSVPGKEAPIWLVTIDEADFKNRFAGRRPFRRCPIVHDLKTILDSKPAVLAIDLDLSPMLDESKDESACQKTLESLLDEESKVRIVLLTPFGKELPADWMMARTEAHFADPDIDVAQSLALEFKCHDLGFAEVAYGVPENVPSKCSSHGKFENGQHHPIDYRAFRALTAEMPASSLKEKVPGMAGQVVFYGNRSGTSDLVVTPLEKEAYGVTVHAAKYATFLSKTKYNGFKAFVLDIVVASVFSMGLTIFLPIYVRSANLIGPVGEARRSVHMITYLASWCVFVLGVTAICWEVFKHCAILAEPLLIILGLAIDAFVLAGWDRVGAAHEQGELECPGLFNLLRAPWMRLGTWLRELEFVARTSYFLAVVTVLRWLIFWLVVAFAVHYSWE